VQRSPDDSGVSECDIETSTVMRFRFVSGCRVLEKNCIQQEVTVVFLGTLVGVQNYEAETHKSTLRNVTSGSW
jgi:hypothetical protein